MKIKTSVYEDDKYQYINLLDYGKWDDYDKILKILETIPRIKPISEIINGPYSRYVDFEYEGYGMTLMYHDEMGNCIRLRKIIAKDMHKSKALELARYVIMYSKKITSGSMI